MRKVQCLIQTSIQSHKLNNLIRKEAINVEKVSSYLYFILWKTSPYPLVSNVKDQVSVLNMIERINMVISSTETKLNIYRNLFLSAIEATLRTVGLAAKCF